MMNPYQPVASVEPETAVPETSPASESVFRPLSWWARSAFIFAGIIIPIGCHLLSLSGAPTAPLWQTGELGDKLSFILSPQAGFIFYPLMIYAIVSLTLYLTFDSKKRVGFWVQLGIYGGVPVALWYSIVLDITTIDSPDEILLIVGQFGSPLAIYALLRFFEWLHRKTVIPIGWYFVGAIVVGGILVGCMFDPGSTFGIIAGGPMIASLVCGPAWAFLVYAYASLRLLRDPRSPRPLDPLEKLSGIAYFAYVLAACPISVLFSLNKYSSLPTQPVSQCYVVTAAARGHRRFVGAKIERIDGIERRVNNQLSRLWAFEQLLIQTCPQGHHRLRKVYDRIGPKLAARVSNPWLADMAYLSLKPVEGLAMVLLWCSHVSTSHRAPSHRAQPTGCRDENQA